MREPAIKQAARLRRYAKTSAVLSAIALLAVAVSILMVAVFARSLEKWAISEMVFRRSECTIDRMQEGRSVEDARAVCAKITLEDIPWGDRFEAFFSANIYSPSDQWFEKHFQLRIEKLPPEVGKEPPAKQAMWFYQHRMKGGE